ncbi:unnamed protein product [Oikopleura dioica]|uniref:V-ATPase 14 kDa subunit n=1 Tax=Oikopleura dioica TaxID=34765 RepID=E4Y8J6_OIKDI|nr:unnamed protein product [Oikopleura dioica]
MLGGKLMTIIGDEDTVTGFLMGGIGELNKERHPNFFVVDKETETKDIEANLKTFLARSDVGIVMITQCHAEKVRHLIDSHVEPIPTILEIPSKDNPYDPEKDSVLKRARSVIGGEG